MRHVLTCRFFGIQRLKIHLIDSNVSILKITKNANSLRPTVQCTYIFTALVPTVRISYSPLRSGTGFASPSIDPLLGQKKSIIKTRI